VTVRRSVSEDDVECVDAVDCFWSDVDVIVHQEVFQAACVEFFCKLNHCLDAFSLPLDPSGPACLAGLESQFLSSVNILLAVIGESVSSGVAKDVFVGLDESVEKFAFVVFLESRIHRLKVVVEQIGILRIFHLEHVCSEVDCTSIGATVVWSQWEVVLHFECFLGRRSVVSDLGGLTYCCKLNPIVNVVNTVVTVVGEILAR
jgi:hypothetical protein